MGACQLCICSRRRRRRRPGQGNTCHRRSVTASTRCLDTLVDVLRNTPIRSVARKNCLNEFTLDDPTVQVPSGRQRSNLSRKAEALKQWDPEGEVQKSLQTRLTNTKRELQQLTQLMEASERRILPMPRRRVTGGSANAVASEVTPQAITPNALFSKLHSLNNEVNAINQALSNVPKELYAEDTSDENSNHFPQHNEEHADFEESEEDDDECTGCRDWLENVKNKKKRKIPTSAVMGHTNSVSSPVQQTHGLGTSPGRTNKSKTRRRRTWDVSSESRPDSSFRSSKDGVSTAVFAVWTPLIHLSSSLILTS